MVIFSWRYKKNINTFGMKTKDLVRSCRLALDKNFRVICLFVFSSVMLFLSGRSKLENYLSLGALKLCELIRAD